MNLTSASLLKNPAEDPSQEDLNSGPFRAHQEGRVGSPFGLPCNPKAMIAEDGARKVAVCVDKSGSKEHFEMMRSASVEPSRSRSLR